MRINTNLEGRIRNTHLPKTKALLPLFEAIVNSIQAIDEAHLTDKYGEIQILIKRKKCLTLNSSANDSEDEEISGFSISDNGIGFNEVNMNSFSTLDSSHKEDKGCRGMGRLLWLKEFEQVTIESQYKSTEATLTPIAFTFTKRGIREKTPLTTLTDTSSTGSTVSLEDLKEEYKPHIPQNAQSIAKAILDHCLWYFLRDDGVPNITIIDREESISLNNLFQEYSNSDRSTDEFTIDKNNFRLIQFKIRNIANNHKPCLYWCAAERVVRKEDLSGKLPGLYDKLSDDRGKFSYACFIFSQYLDDNVRSNRTSFDIAEKQSQNTFDGYQPSLESIRREVLSFTKQFLSASLEKSQKTAQDRVNNFVANVAPRYRPLLKYMTANGIDFDPSIKDDELELALHTELQRIQHESLKEGKELIETKTNKFEDADYRERLNNYLAQLNDLNKSDLAAYVARRYTMIDLLQNATQIQDDGQYSKEAAVHSLLFPMKCDSNEVNLESANLWIIDERLAFHDFLASDKPLCSLPITDSPSHHRPDIIADRVHYLNHPLLATNSPNRPLQEISIVEIKRPMKSDVGSKDNDPIQQALDYLKEIRNHNAKTSTGRPINVPKNTPAFCYILADLTIQMRECCQDHDLIERADTQSYFGYIKSRNAFIEVLSFDALLQNASERNRAFFDKLGLPATSH